jgi:hypothetical protein
MTRPTFPPTPELVDDQVFSSAIVRYGHRAGIEYLLGESHAAYALPHVRTPSTDVYQEEYQTIWELWCYQASQTAYYKLQILIFYGNEFDRDWYYRLQVSPDGGTTWYTAREATGTQNTYQDEDGTVDLTAIADGAGGYVSDHLTLTNIYLWRLQVKCGRQADPADCTVHCVPWGIGTRGAVSGWVAPPVFAAGPSSAAHANTLRTDLYALYNALSAVNVATSQPSYTIVSFSSTWTELSRMAYRYRPDTIRVAVAASGWGDGSWQWRAKVEDKAGNSAVVYTSAAIVGNEATEPEQYAWDTAEVDLTAGAAAAALTAAGITLTVGEWYRVVVEIYTTADPGRVWGFGARADRLSSGTPGAGYSTPNLWQHGDDDVGPTHLNVYSGDLTALYSGAEALFLDSPAVDVVADTAGHSLVHRKRYLHYHNASGASIFYGAGYATSYGLSDASGWAWVDLEEIGLPYGGAYWVRGCDAAMECDIAG